MDALIILKNYLVSEPVMAFPRVDRICSSLMQPLEEPTLLVDWEQSSQSLKNTPTFSPSPLRQGNSRITRKTIKTSLFFWKLQQLYGAWMYSMNTLKAKNLSSTPITT
jgi:hypothetical protein